MKIDNIIRFLACSSLFLLLLAGMATAQTITLKLEWQDSVYAGKMDPGWFEEVRLMPAGGMPQAWEGATGYMAGTPGKMEFVLAKNTLGTPEEWMLKTPNGWYPLEGFTVKGERVKLKFDWAFRPEARPEDLKVLRRVATLLADSSSWNYEDDRKCEDDMENQNWSLYCACRQASLDETGDFNHRGASLNQVRRHIGTMRPDRKYQHRLMDFNNEESFETIQSLILACIRQLEEEFGK